MKNFIFVQAQTEITVYKFFKVQAENWEEAEEKHFDSEPYLIREEGGEGGGWSWEEGEDGIYRDGNGVEFDGEYNWEF